MITGGSLLPQWLATFFDKEVELHLVAKAVLGTAMEMLGQLGCSLFHCSHAGSPDLAH